MSAEQSNPILRYLWRVAVPLNGGDATDRELLRRFTLHADDSAFTALVHRHGPMVLGVCLRVLRDFHDAEDAFQATFVVLARKAQSLRNPEQLANWLHGVARRTAQEAKTLRHKRAVKESNAPVKTSEPSFDAIWAEVREILDEEIELLPKRWRLPFVLCYLEGKTNEEAARLLAWPKGTVVSRLSWARERLRKRLTRRGIGLSAAMLTTTLAKAAGTTLPKTLMHGTVQTALASMSSSLAGSAAVAKAVMLAKGVVNLMWWSKLKACTAVVLVIAALGTGGGVTAYRIAYAQGQGAAVTFKVLAAVPPPRQGPALQEELEAAEAIKKFGGEVELDPQNHVVAVRLFDSKMREKHGAADDLIPLLLKLPKLKQFEMRLGVSMTAKSFPLLGELRSLESLRMFGFNSTPAELELGADLMRHIARLDQLQELVFQLNYMNNDGMKSVAALKNLRTLDVSGNHLTDDGLKELAGLRQLQFLSIRRTDDYSGSMMRIGDKGLAHLAGLTQLRELNFARSEVTSEGLLALKDLKDLESLSFHRNNLNDKGMAYLAQFSQLKKLVLDNTLVTDEGMIQLRNLKGLRHLRINGGSITAKGLGSLVQLHELERLEVSSHLLTDANLAMVSSLPKLRTLEIFGEYGTTPPFSTEGFSKLVEARGLEELRIIGMPVSPRGVPIFKILQQLTRLRGLTLQDAFRENVRDFTPISNKDLDSLRRALPTTKVEIFHQGISPPPGLSLQPAPQNP